MHIRTAFLTTELHLHCKVLISPHQAKQGHYSLVSKTPLLQALSLPYFLLPLPATTGIVSTLKQMPKGFSPGSGRALQSSQQTKQCRYHFKTKFVWGNERKKGGESK